VDRILILDRDQIFSQTISSFVEDQFQILSEVPARAISSIVEFQPHIILLPLEPASLTVMQEIRRDRQLRRIGVLLTTSRDSSLELETAYSMGADGLLLKPPKFETVIWQVKTLLQRVKDFPRFQNLLVTWKNSELNLSTLKLTFDQQSFELTPLQAEILFLLFENHDRLVTREQLKEKIWKGSTISPRSIDAHISKLKRSIGPFAQYITSVYGKGYCLSDSASSAAI
jgi:DNA-binding response OmpR family regulator